MKILMGIGIGTAQASSANYNELETKNEEISLEVESETEDSIEQLETPIRHSTSDVSFVNKWILPSIYGFLATTATNQYATLFPGTGRLPLYIADNFSCMLGLSHIQTLRSLLGEEIPTMGRGMQFVMQFGAAALVGNTYRLTLNEIGYCPEDTEKLAIVAVNALVQSVGTLVTFEGLKAGYPYLKQGFFAVKKALCETKPDESNHLQERLLI